PLDEQTLRRLAHVDYVTFTSSSTVRFFLRALADGGASLSAAARIVSIGPVTSETLLKHGLKPYVQASAHDVDGMIEALLRDARGDTDDELG
ncbi:MAG TPA: uroporphyrinogen-III synthase, partial [Solirubrobacteraceae bacterium]|nr:uroporphyrinogen-III synthase [Solirubrobacteraceae bacterium]